MPKNQLPQVFCLSVTSFGSWQLGNSKVCKEVDGWWLVIVILFLGVLDYLRWNTFVICCCKGKSLKNYHGFWGVEWVVMQIYMEFFSLMHCWGPGWCHIMTPGMNNSIHDLKSLHRMGKNATRKSWLRVQVNCFVDLGDVTSKISGLCHVVSLIYTYGLVYGNMLFQAFQVFISTYNYADISLTEFMIVYV